MSESIDVQYYYAKAAHARAEAAKSEGAARQEWLKLAQVFDEMALKIEKGELRQSRVPPAPNPNRKKDSAED